MAKSENSEMNPPELQKIPKVESELSKIASNPKQSIFLVAIGVLLVAYLAYTALQGSDQPKKRVEAVVQKPKVILNPASSIDAEDIVAPRLDMSTHLRATKTIEKAQKSTADVGVSSIIANVPKVTDSRISSQLSQPQTSNSAKPFTPGLPIVPQSSLTPTPKSNSGGLAASPLSTTQLQSDVKPPVDSFIPKVTTPDDIKKKAQRQKSSIMLMSGTPKKTEAEIKQNQDFKAKGSSEYLLSEGKIIDAVLETAFNSDFPSDMRAIVSRDVYAEGGRNILIPKGSRIFGAAQADTTSEYARVTIKWSRLDLPSGFSMNISSTSIDELGRKGTQARRDTKVKEKISSTVITSALNILYASAVDKVTASSKNNNTNGSGDAGNVLTNVTNTWNSNQSYMNSTPQPGAMISALCASARGAITNPASSLYAQVNSLCQTAQIPPITTTSAQNLYSGLTEAANNASATSGSVASAVQSSTQTAAVNAMSDFSKTMADIAKENVPKTTVTLDQGAKLKVYINKDYLFPEAAVVGTRVVQ